MVLFLSWYFYFCGIRLSSLSVFEKNSTSRSSVLTREWTLDFFSALVSIRFARIWRRYLNGGQIDCGNARLRGVTEARPYNKGAGCVTLINNYLQPAALGAGSIVRFHFFQTRTKDVSECLPRYDEPDWSLSRRGLRWFCWERKPYELHPW